MKKGLQISMVSLAVLLMIGHSLLPHIHELSEGIEHHEDKDHHGNLIHLGPLDESTAPVKLQHNISQPEFVVDQVFPLYEFLHLADFTEKPVIVFEEYPPPEKYTSCLLYTSDAAD